ncbi:hypothetical protein [Micromonospora thermarum]|uniref:hypothetical protein n=1 Tax=Micromonospora thermarum TaxID=2720024 RepID=UPI001F0D66FF|nr:hypothetical protein [Micromonospora thermarum]
MDNRNEVREFLVSRRAKVSPEQAGVPAGTNRRAAAPPTAEYDDPEPSGGSVSR